MNQPNDQATPHRQPIFALVDCNNFFASCERLFRPELEHKPVVVLSSNDGCVVARSNEAKKLGIPMGAPVFKIRDELRRHNITQFSGNFELYGDISKRITALLTTVTPRIEIYSVDESFLDVSQLNIADYIAWAKVVRTSILRNIGVPVSIGIATSKTLAKLASEIAKQHDEYGGVFSFIDLNPVDKQALLAQTPVQEIWGIGRRLAPKVRAEGAGNAWALATASPWRMQQIMGIHGRQLVSELNGISCYPLEAEHGDIKSIMRTRTFGEDTRHAYVLEAAIATLASRAAYHLRNHHLLAKRIGLFTTTNRHKPGYRRWMREIELSTPTNDTGLIISVLTKELTTFYSNKQLYHRLGVFLYDLTDENALQLDLLDFTHTANHDRAKARMEAVDAVNAKWGKGKVYFAAEDLSKAWQPKQAIRSPQYVSDWKQLPTVRPWTSKLISL